MPAARFPGIRPVDRPGFTARVRLTGTALGYALAGFPALLLWILTTVALAIIPTGIGLLALLGLVPAVATLAGRHRTVTGELTATRIPARYADLTGAGPIRRLLGWARDQVRWRDYAFLAFSATGGLLMCALPVLLAAAPVSHVVIAIVDGGWTWLLLLAIGPSVLGWWILTPILLAARLRAERHIFGSSEADELRARAERATAARVETIDHSAAELRRIERDLHDGAQARMVSLGMNLGLAGELLRTDPDTAAELLEEARTTTLSALADLRSVVQGMHPPVLADRGLVGAVQALALDVAVPVTVSARLPGRAPAPVESAVYFAVSECLANVVKHSGATRAWVVLDHDHDMLSAVVGDDGRGGATTSSTGTGLAGLVRRLATFEGRTTVSSPPGGPTTIRMEVPCRLSAEPA